MPTVHDMLMQAESAWELFLRRAGMNAYAAQVIPGLAGLLSTDTTTEIPRDSSDSVPSGG
ncbi:hypothetical protein Micbo1qcDRAFT_157706, partial [Microdochium bolleyi]